MLYMRLAERFQSYLANAFRNPKESRPHISWKGFNLCADLFVEDFYLPRHFTVYLKFEIRYHKAPLAMGGAVKVHNKEFVAKRELFYAVSRSS
jgi:hypothetical protein